MIKHAIIGALLLGLGSCTTVSNLVGTTVPESEVSAAVLASDLAIKTAGKYKRLPLCTAAQPTACSKVAVTAVMDKDVAAVQAARSSLWASAKANGGATPFSALSALSAATTALTNATPIN